MRNRLGAAMARRSKIFINYRRGDASADARSVYQSLEPRYGAKRVFMDVDSIQRGRDFREALESQLEKTSVMLVLIGQRWLDFSGPDGGRRLDDPADYVRIEIAQALRDGIPVIPVLLNDTPSPNAEELPEDISALAFRQAAMLRHVSFRSDIEELKKAVNAALSTAKGAGASGALGLPAVLGGMAVVGLVLGWVTANHLFLTAADEEVAVGAAASIEGGAAAHNGEATQRLQQREIQSGLAALGFYSLTVDGEWGSASKAALQRFQRQAGMEANGEPSEQVLESLRLAAEERTREAALHRAIRVELTRLGDYVGPLDGGWDALSSRALTSFARREGLELDGAPSEAILTTLRKAEKPPSFSQRLSSLAQGEALKECDVCPAMVAIPGGEFSMGSPPGEAGRDLDEGPQLTVHVATFALGKYETTIGEWEACATDGYCSAASIELSDVEAAERAKYPVFSVSWFDIVGRDGGGVRGFVAWLNSKVEGAPYRLPSEAEWEYAARAGGGGPFWWGAAISPDQANYNGAQVYAGGGHRGVFRGAPVSVEMFNPNDFGLFHVHGNVWEWVADCWSDDYASAPDDGSPRLSGVCTLSPLRGGSWAENPRYLRSAQRLGEDKSVRDSRYGFRIARTLAD